MGMKWKLVINQDLEAAINRETNARRLVREAIEKREAARALNAQKRRARAALQAFKKAAKASKRARAVARVWANVEARAAERDARKETAAAHALAKKMDNLARL